MRNTFLVLKREYLERVQKKSFLISTLLLPALMYAMIVLPAKLATLKVGKPRHIVVVASNTAFGDAVKAELAAPTKQEKALPTRNDNLRDSAQATYIVDVDLTATEAERAALRARVTKGELDGFIWATDEAIAGRKVTYAARETTDFVEPITLTRAVTQASIKQNLQGRGMTPKDIGDLFKSIDMDVLTIKAGGDTKVTGGPMAFMGPFVMAMLLYMTVILYAVAVMRAVLEEKNSRVMEVLLSSVTSQQLMTGKVLGVGAVGITQILIWVAMFIGVISPAMAGGALGGIQIPRPAMLWFGVFYALGYVLYSTLYAALGAMVNSEQEAQQWQTFIMLPLIISVMLMMFIVRQPNSALAFWGSMVPLVAPILMYVRIAVQTPPLWQILVSIALMVATIYGMLVLCGRIYRIGILMYGKRPTLPEIMKWIKYA
jgi:ABC-2 type transport system permease protein